MNLCTANSSVEQGGEALITGLDRLNVTLQIPRLRECRGMDQAKFELLVEKMAADALTSGSPQNNPVVPTPQQIVQLYHEAW